MPKWLLTSRSTDEVAKVLDELIAELQGLLNLLPSQLSFEQLYRVVYKIGLFKMDDLLYARLSQMLEDHLRQKIAPSLVIALSQSSPEASIESISDDSLRAILHVVDDYVFCLQAICDIATQMVGRRRFVFCACM
jgi:hypothetical protein